MKKRILIVMAMKEEAREVFASLSAPETELIFTGLGKVNATYALMKSLLQNGRPDLVVNFGTAGSSKFPTFSTIECTRFVQRDIDLSAIGFQAGLTPFEETPAVIEVPKRLAELQSGSCGTGDSFETGRPKVSCDVVDMEAYALAKVCYLEEIPFLCVKFISDGADRKASNDWNGNLPKAAERFAETFKNIEQLKI